MLNTIRGNDFKFTVASNISLRSLKSGKDIYLYWRNRRYISCPAGAPRGGHVVINELTNNQSVPQRKAE